jgi:hypothetical protein
MKWITDNLFTGISFWVNSSTAEDKNARNYTYIPTYVFMAWWLLKHKDNFSISITFIFSILLVNPYKHVSVRNLFSSLIYIALSVKIN